MLILCLYYEHVEIYTFFAVVSGQSSINFKVFLHGDDNAIYYILGIY